MAKQIINVGTAANAGDGEPLRDALVKTNGNFTELYNDLASLTKADVGLSNVNNTSDAQKPISTATQTALDNKAGNGAIASSGLTTTGPTLLGKSTNGSGAVQELTATLAKTFLVLDQVSNTSDLNKPLSTATITALSNKADTSHTHVAADIQLTGPSIVGKSTSGAGAATGLTVAQTKTFLAINNLDNTSDADKPLSTLMVSALATKAPISHTHTISQITDLQSALDNKSDLTHNHDITTLIGYSAAMALKADVTAVVYSVKGFMATPTANLKIADVSDAQWTVVPGNCKVLAGVAATASTTFTIKKNDATIGTATFDADSAVGAVTISGGGGRTMLVGDVIEFIAPSSPDTTLARVSFVIRN
jgi:hypothetical protein